MGDMTHDVDRRMIPLADLRPHPRNYNRHPARQVERIAASLRAFGQRKPVTTWRGYVLTGVGTLLAAQSLAWTHIWHEPCPNEWEENQAMAWLAADNELGRLADPDMAQLAEILEESRQADAALLEAIGYDDEEFDQLIARVGLVGAQIEDDSMDTAGVESDPPLDARRYDLILSFDTEDHRASARAALIAMGYFPKYRQ